MKRKSPKYQLMVLFCFIEAPSCHLDWIVHLHFNSFVLHVIFVTSYTKTLVNCNTVTLIMHMLPSDFSVHTPNHSGTYQISFLETHFPRVSGPGLGLHQRPQILQMEELALGVSPCTSKHFYYTPKNFKIPIISSEPFTVKR